MTNRQRQKELDEQRHLESETERRDMSGDMPYCNYCAYTAPFATCAASQEKRETKCLCAKAYNKMKKDAKMDENKQIEEMVKVIVDREKYNVSGYTTCKMCDLKKCDLHCSKYSDIRYDCEALFEAGCRKADDIIDRLMNAKDTSEITEKELEFFVKHNEKVRKETAKEIFQILYDRTQNYYGNRIVLTSQDVKELAKEYGVEVERE